MTITIDLATLLAPWLYIAIYIFGLIIAANIAAVRYRRHYTLEDDEVDVDVYIAAAVLWPIYVFIFWIIYPLLKLLFNIAILPSKLFK
jgi:hypothetical protein